MSEYKIDNCHYDSVTAESEQRVVGKWVDYVGMDLGIENQWLRDDGKTVFIQCDRCGHILVRNFFEDANYCPNCGARMDGGEQKHESGME